MNRVVTSSSWDLPPERSLVWLFQDNHSQTWFRIDWIQDKDTTSWKWHSKIDAEKNYKDKYSSPLGRSADTTTREARATVSFVAPAPRSPLIGRPSNCKSHKHRNLSAIFCLAQILLPVYLLRGQIRRSPNQQRFHFKALHMLHANANFFSKLEAKIDKDFDA